MTQIMFSGDHHFDESSRFAECMRVHDWMVDKARELAIDAFVSTGDIYERASTPNERHTVATWLQAMAEVCRVVIVKGNHDRKRDCSLMARLQSAHPILVCESVGEVEIGGVSLGLVAWPERTSVLQWARDRGVSPDLAEREALRALLQGLGQRMRGRNMFTDSEMPRILAGHFAIEGALVSAGQPLIGQAMGVTLSDLDLAEANLVVCGHIHKPQDWSVARKTPVLYTGSPYRTAYGETEQKSVLLVRYDNVDRDGALTWDRIPTPCAPMHLIEGRWNGMDFGDDVRLQGDLAHLQADWNGSNIRLRYHVSVDDRLPAAATASDLRDAWLDMGACDVKLDEIVEATSRARAPEITAALNLGDKLELLWAARGDIPVPMERARLLSMAAELQEAVR